MPAWLDSIFASMMMAMRQPLESFIRLETADDEDTLAAEDGSLVSFIRVDGSRQIVGDAEYALIVEQATIKLGSRFDKPGHGLQIYFMRNPDRIREELRNISRPNQQAAQAIGLELGDLFDEKIRTLARWTAWEDFYFVLWTRPSVLTKSDLERSRKEAKERKWVLSAEAQYPFVAIPALRTRHKSFVTGVLTSLNEMGIQARMMGAHDALRAARASIYPSRIHDRWKPCLPGDPIPVRKPQAVNDMSEILWPPIRRQMTIAGAEVLSPTVVKIDDLIWAGVDMTLAPMEPAPFPALMNRLVEAGMPFRISFLMEGGGVEGAAARKFIVSVLGFSSSVNKQIKASLDSLIALAGDEPVVRLRISLSTWAPHDQPKLLDDRVSVLVQALEGWGYCQASQIAGDPLDAVMSSALGIACASTAPPVVAPMVEVMKLLPWHRPSSPFGAGAILFRTDDGKLWPYQTGSTLTTTWFDLIFAQPGAGKSVLMNALSLGTCLTAGVSRLPFVAIIDIGPSSSGLISLIKDALPPGRRHEAAHYKLRLTQEYAVNPFDTQLGCRFPLPDERSYLVELLTLLSTPPGQANPYDGIPQLAGLVVDEMFRWRSDGGAGTESRPYLTRIDNDVDEALARHNIHLPDEPYWWDVVDALFDEGLIHEATLAQRHAVPTLTDAVTAARRPQIRNLLEETRIGASAEGVIHAFERMIASSIRELPNLASITRFDIAGARICALDLQEVAPQGDETADRQTAIMYMLARHTMVRHWWLGEDTIKHMPERYRGHHSARLRDIRETPKRLCYDEFHRTSRSRSVRAQVVRDVREGRKWGVQIVLASQLLDDFNDEMVDLATGVWILGAAASDRSVEFAAKRFALSDSARWIMRNRLTGPRASGAPCLLVLATNEGRYEQFLFNTLGPVELWALSTSAEDVIVRNQLYARLGAAKARHVLSAYYPGGSIRSELRRRVVLRAEAGEIEGAAQSAVMKEIIDELADAALRHLRHAGE